MSATFYRGDCLKWIKTFPENSVNLIYFNPPFGTTRQDWDSKLNWKLLFAEFDRVLKPEGNIVIHCSVPFNYTLIREAPRPPTYSWYWLKNGTTCPYIAKVQPLRNTEEILVWKGNKGAVYYPQRTNTEIDRVVTPSGISDYYGKTYAREAKSVKGFYQTHHIQMNRTVEGFSTRPVEMVELMLKSYTQEGDVVLDPTCYQGMCGAIAKRMNRKWIGIDLNFFPVKLLNESTTNT